MLRISVLLSLAQIFLLSFALKLYDLFSWASPRDFRLSLLQIQLSPKTRPFFQVCYLLIHPDAKIQVLPTPQAVIHHALLFQTTHCYFVTILSGEDISTVVLFGLLTANLAHFHFIAQLEESSNNKNQMVPTPHLKHASNFSLF